MFVQWRLDLQAGTVHRRILGMLTRRLPLKQVVYLLEHHVINQSEGVPLDSRDCLSAFVRQYKCMSSIAHRIVFID